MTNRTCEQDGCFEEATVDCREPDSNIVIWYCTDHAVANGFCYLCGTFSAGFESFDFSPMPGVCEACRYEMEAEYDDDEEYEPDEFEDEPY